MLLLLGQQHSASFQPMDLCASVCAGVRGGSLEGAAAQDRQRATTPEVLRALRGNRPWEGVETVEQTLVRGPKA